MFEHLSTAVAAGDLPVDPLAGVCWADLADEPDEVAGLSAGELESLFGADLERDCPPMTALEVLAWIESSSIGPDTAADLFRLDTAELDEAANLRVSAQWQRLENAAGGHKLAAVAAFEDGCVRAAGENGGAAASLEADFLDCEVAVALALSTPSAARVLSEARMLTRRLPATALALSMGLIGYYQARKLIEYTGELTAAQCALVESRVLAKAAGKAPGKVGELVRREVAKVDPDALARRQKHAKRSAFLDVAVDSGSGDGTGHLTGAGPHLDLAQIRTAVEAWARGRKAAGDPRPLDELRLAALVDWSARYLTGTPISPDPATDPRVPEPTDDDVPITG
jgi:hypothetical protein